MNTVTIPTSTTGNGVSSSYTEERQSKKSGLKYDYCLFMRS